MQSSAKHKAELKWLHSTEAANQAAADNFKAGLKWLQTPEAAKLSFVVRDNRLTNFSQHTIILNLFRSHPTAAIFLFVSRLFHNKTGIV